MDTCGSVENLKKQTDLEIGGFFICLIPPKNQERREARILRIPPQTTPSQNLARIPYLYFCTPPHFS